MGRLGHTTWKILLLQQIIFVAFEFHGEDTMTTEKVEVDLSSLVFRCIT